MIVPTLPLGDRHRPILGAEHRGGDRSLRGEVGLREQGEGVHELSTEEERASCQRENRTVRRETAHSQEKQMRQLSFSGSRNVFLTNKIIRLSFRFFVNTFCLIAN